MANCASEYAENATHHGNYATITMRIINERKRHAIRYFPVDTTLNIDLLCGA